MKLFSFCVVCKKGSCGLLRILNHNLRTIAIPPLYEKLVKKYKLYVYVPSIDFEFTNPKN